MAAYQVAPYIGQAIDSVLDQTYPAHEIIVCDDGSTDNLDEALEPYREKIILLHQENRGAAAARNAAAKVATGDFVLFLDPDDFFLPTRLERLAELANQRPDLEILTTDAWIEVDGTILDTYYTDTNRFVTVDQRSGILNANFLFGLLAVRATALMRIGGYDESLRSVYDWDCWIRLILAGSRAGVVTEPLAVYRIRPGSDTSDRWRLLNGRVEVLQRAVAQTDLSARERLVAERSLVTAQRALTLFEVQRSLMCGDPNARALCWKVATESGFSTRSRMKCLVSAVAPRLTGSGLRWRDQRRARHARGLLAARQ